LYCHYERLVYSKFSTFPSHRKMKKTKGEVIMVFANFNNLSISKKISGAITIFVLPLALMGYFLVTEKDALITFTNQEKAGVSYLRATQSAVDALVLAVPSKAAYESAIDALHKAEVNDAGGLLVTKKAQDLSAALQLLAHTPTDDSADAIAKAADLNSSISDNSNITLDPDADAYFVGDIIVNQSTGVLLQSKALLNAAKALDATDSIDNKIAFAEARDGLLASSGNVMTDLTKAMTNNTDGMVRKALEKSGADVTQALDQVAAAIKGGARPAVLTAAAHLVQEVQGLREKNNNEMDRLLDARNAGYHDVLLTRLGISLFAALLGAFIALVVVRSITRPLTKITQQMESLTQGDLSIDIPQTQRSDEIGGLIKALQVFHTAMLDRTRAQSLEEERVKSEMARAIHIRQLNEEFNEQVNKALHQLKEAAIALNGSTAQMADGSTRASQQANTVARAAERASENVQTVAAATEELSASIREISDRIGASSALTTTAVEQAQSTRSQVSGLKDATGKIGDVVKFINDIAGQTNLLALNATIEAARAGDAGKGFAVVASEVKLLANQTAHATEDISKHISAIQDSVQGVSKAIELIVTTIMSVSETSTAIACAVKQQGAATQEISRNVQEAAQGTQEVSERVAQIAGVIADTEEMSHTINDTSLVLDQQTENLKEDVLVYLSAIKTA
jgi:methyl-accepting chemotaxis protein